MISNLIQAIELLHARLKVDGISTPSLANHVNRTNVGRTEAKHCYPVPDLNSPMNVTAVSALLELARASRNPKDWSISAIHQWWAFLRYLAFFDQSGDYLTVGAEGRAFTHNQRRVASEELGVAFSLLVGRRWTASMHGRSAMTSVTDIELALTNRSHGVEPVRGRTKRPDWLLTVGDPTNPLEYKNYFLESKGTAKDSHARNQLVAAARQLESLTVRGVTPKGLAVSTITGNGRVRYMAVDPGEEPDPVQVDPESMVSLVQEGQELARGGEVDAHYLTAASVYWSLVGLADFARSTVALRRLEAPARPVADLSATTIREHPTELGPVDGVERIWRLPEGRVSIVVGVGSEINQKLERGDIAGALERRAQWAVNVDELQYVSLGTSVQSSARTDRVSATAAASDGAILSISIVD